MKFELKFSEKADEQLEALENTPSKKAACKAVKKILGYMEANLRHPSLKTHEFTSMKGKKGEKVFEAYAQNDTPGAYRVFWHYGPGDREIFILMITPHP